MDKQIVTLQNSLDQMHQLLAGMQNQLAAQQAEIARLKSEVTFKPFQQSVERTVAKTTTRRRLLKTLGLTVLTTGVAVQALLPAAKAQARVISGNSNIGALILRNGAVTAGEALTSNNYGLVVGHSDTVNLSDLPPTSVSIAALNNHNDRSEDIGIYSRSNTGTAIFAFSADGVAIHCASASNYALAIESGSPNAAPLFLLPKSASGAPQQGTFTTGAILVDQDGALFVYTKSGWKQVQYV